VRPRSPTKVETPKRTRPGSRPNGYRSTASPNETASTPWFVILTGIALWVGIGLVFPPRAAGPLCWFYLLCGSEANLDFSHFVKEMLLAAI
jgi:hypothetical protein